MNRLLLAALLFLCSCVSDPFSVPWDPIGPDEEQCGTVNGSAGGVLIFSLIPAGINNRFQKAYDNALKKTEGGTRVVNIRAWESWYFVGIGDLHIFHVEGTAVRKKTRPK